MMFGLMIHVIAGCLVYMATLCTVVVSLVSVFPLDILTETWMHVTYMLGSFCIAAWVGFNVLAVYTKMFPIDKGAK